MLIQFQSNFSLLYNYIVIKYALFLTLTCMCANCQQHFIHATWHLKRELIICDVSRVEHLMYLHYKCVQKLSTLPKNVCILWKIYRVTVEGKVKLTVATTLFKYCQSSRFNKILAIVVKNVIHPNRLTQPDILATNEEMRECDRIVWY